MQSYRKAKCGWKTLVEWFIKHPIPKNIDQLPLYPQHFRFTRKKITIQTTVIRATVESYSSRIKNEQRKERMKTQEQDRTA